jgi:hypothetical protein
MSAAGVLVDREALIERLKEAKDEAVATFEADTKKAAIEDEKRKKRAIEDLRKRLKAMEAGKDDPGDSTNGGFGWNRRYNNTGAPNPDTLKATLDSIDRAIRVFRIGTEDTVRLGPKLIQDLGLGRYL